VITCQFCNGSGVVFNQRGGTQCSRCKGQGKVAPPPEATKPKICIIGEAWGAEEARLGMPFVGASGRELDRILEEAEIDKRDCHLTNVFNLQPQPSNDIKNLCTDAKSSSVPMPALSKGAYLQDKYFPEVQRLWKELAELRPNLALCVGNTPLWALTGSTGIRSLRGTVSSATYGPVGLKVLPTYHPAAVLRDWSSRPVVVADFMKAKRQALFPEVRRPARRIWIEPDLRDIEKFYKMYALKTTKLSADIETTGKSMDAQISCVGFAPSKELAICIPFVDPRKPGGSYWPSAHQEKIAWQWVDRFLKHVENEDITILGQNFLFDVNWLWTKVGLTPRNFTADTMLKHHAINPELEKGLGFMGSIYTDEPAWKLMRKTDNTKRGE
jgi:uracil-DNA glycosylase